MIKKPLLLSIFIALASTLLLPKNASVVSYASSNKLEDAVVESHIRTALNNDTYFIVKLDKEDYFDSTHTNYGSNTSISSELINELGLLNSIKINGQTLNSYSNTFSDFDFVYNHYTLGGLCFKCPTITSIASQVISFEISQGAKFPVVNIDSTGITYTNQYYEISSKYYVGPLDTSSLEKENKELTVVGIDDTTMAHDSYGYFYIRFKEDVYIDSSTNPITYKTPIYFNNISVDLSLFNILSKIEIDGKLLNQYTTKTKDLDISINRWQRWNTLSFKVPGISDVRDVLKFKILPGLEIPAYEYDQKMIVMTNSFTSINSDFQFGYEIPDNALSYSKDETFVTFDIKMYFPGVTSFSSVDKNKVLINKISLSDIENSSASLSKKSFVTLTIKIPLEYENLLNKDSNLTGNKISLLEGLKIDDTHSLSRGFVISIYDYECITEFLDEDSEDEYISNGVSAVIFRKAESNEKDHEIVIKFAQSITGDKQYYAITNEAWRKQNLESYNYGVLYNEQASLAFMHDGYKSSLLDNILINGRSLSDITHELPVETISKYALMVHMGSEKKNQINIMISHYCTDFTNEINSSYETGNFTLTFKKGLKFSNKSMCKEEQMYSFNKATDSFMNLSTESFAVYYDGTNVNNNEIVESTILPSINNVYIPNDGNDYVISCSDTDEENVSLITISLDENIIFTFKVHYTITEVEASGCASSIYSEVGLIAFIPIALALLLIRRRKLYEK